MKILKIKDINVNFQTQYGQTALHYACDNNMLEVVLALLKIKDIYVNYQNNYGYTALHYACQNSMPSALELLEREDIDVNLQSNSKQTALHFACYYNIPIALELLKIKGINVNIRTKTGKNALHIVCNRKRDSIILTILEKYGSDETTQHLCSQYKKKEYIGEECNICLSKPCDTLLIHADTLGCHSCCRECSTKLPHCHICRSTIDYTFHK